MYKGACVEDRSRKSRSTHISHTEDRSTDKLYKAQSAVNGAGRGPDEGGRGPETEGESKVRVWGYLSLNACHFGSSMR